MSSRFRPVLLVAFSLLTAGCEWNTPPYDPASVARRAGLVIDEDDAFWSRVRFFHTHVEIAQQIWDGCKDNPARKNAAAAATCGAAQFSFLATKDCPFELEFLQRQAKRRGRHEI